MSDHSDDDPANETDWVLSMRREVEDYLRDQDLDHGEIGDWPAWHIAPITTIWAIESRISPGWVGWWVICGDHQTDYVSSAQTEHPRAVLRALCTQWKELVRSMKRGEPHPTMRLDGSGELEELANLFEVRIKTFKEWAADDGVWNYDEGEFGTS